MSTEHVSSDRSNILSQVIRKMSKGNRKSKDLVSFIDRDSVNNIDTVSCEQLQSNGVVRNNNNVFNVDLTTKGFNFRHLNVQRICSQNMAKFSQLKAFLTSPVNSSLHIFGLSETKLKEHKLSIFFCIDGFQVSFRKGNTSNGGGGIMVYVRNGINAKRRADLETNNISCIWLEITPDRGKSFLVCNMNRPPNSKVEFSDRFENFIDGVLREEKEVILMGDLN